MTARLVKWNRTACGSTFSKCGRFSIKPATGVEGRLGFGLKKIGTVPGPGGPRSFSEDYGIFPTIAKAKAYAEVTLKTEAAQLSDLRDAGVSPHAAKLPTSELAERVEGELTRTLDTLRKLGVDFDLVRRDDAKRTRFVLVATIDHTAAAPKPTRHSIPIKHESAGRSPFYGSEAILRVEGVSHRDAPGGWGVGGWTIHGEGRIVDQGPLVRGPHAYLFGVCGVIDNRGGTGADHAAADAKGLLFDVKAGDELELGGMIFVLSIDRGEPKLEVKGE